MGKANTRGEIGAVKKKSVSKNTQTVDEALREAHDALLKIKEKRPRAVAAAKAYVLNERTVTLSAAAVKPIRGKKGSLAASGATLLAVLRRSQYVGRKKKGGKRDEQPVSILGADRVPLCNVLSHTEAARWLGSTRALVGTALKNGTHVSGFLVVSAAADAVDIRTSLEDMKAIRDTAALDETNGQWARDGLDPTIAVQGRAGRRISVCKLDNTVLATYRSANSAANCGWLVSRQTIRSWCERVEFNAKVGRNALGPCKGLEKLNVKFRFAFEDEEISELSRAQVLAV